MDDRAIRILWWDATVWESAIMGEHFSFLQRFFMRLYFTILALCMPWLDTTNLAIAQRQEGTLKVGDTAPVFRLKHLDGKAAADLKDLKGKPVVLFFGSCT